MKSLSIDIETYSDVPLQKTGVYRYVESPNFEILLFAYSADSQPVRVIDLACGEQIPKEVLLALEDESVIKWAFNATFERICLSRFLGYPTGEYLEPESWRCSMIWAVTMGLPLSLEGVGAVLGLEKQKLSEEKDLIKYFATPVLPRKSMGNVQEIAPSRLRINVPSSKYIMSVMWRPKCASSRGSQSFPFQIKSGMNTIKTKKSMTVVYTYGYIEKFIEHLGERFNIREIDFDRWGAVQMIQNLEGMGFTVVPFGQGFKDMSPPTKELMKRTLEQKLAHGGHPYSVG